MRWGLLLSLVACSSVETPMLIQLSSVEGPFVGVALEEHSSRAQLGMLGNTCTVEAKNGLVSRDRDLLNDRDDRIHDTYEGHTLVSSDEHWLRVDEELEPLEEGLGSFQKMFLHQDGMTGVDDACTVVRGGERWETSLDCTLATLDVLRSDGSIAGADGSKGVVVGGDGTSWESALFADIVVWDQALEVLYTGDTGGETLAAWSKSGDKLWETALGGQIVALDDLSGKQEAVVMLNAGELPSEMVRVDGISGEVLRRSEIPDGGESVFAGDNGSAVAVQLPNEIHFFAVDR